MKILILLLLASALYAKASEPLKIYGPKDSATVPAEVTLILNSLPPDNLIPDEKAKLNAFILNFSRYSRQLSMTDLYFIVKTEVSKLLLSSRPDRSTQYRSYTSKRLNEIETTADWPAYTPWAQFAFRALLKDGKALVADARFPSLWSPTQTAVTNPGEMAVLRKRVELVITWIDYFAYTAVPSVNSDMEQLALKALGRIERAAWIISALTHQPDPKLTDSIFELKQLSVKPLAQSAEELLNNIVDPVIKTAMPSLPTPVNDWVPSEIPNAPNHGPNIIKKKDPFYSAPSKLPKPTNDWIMSL